jgi:hypothetical protein
VGSRLLLWLAIAGAAFGCKRNRADEPPPPTVAIPDTVPAGLAVAKYTGASACKDCHEDQYAAWKSSPHGLAMTLPGDGNLLGRFDDAAVEVPGGTVTPFERDGSPWMRVQSAGGPAEEHRVDIVLGAGRQHQTYLTRLPDGSLRLMPLFWTTMNGRWIATDLYTHGSLDQRSEHYWYGADMINLGCTSCHLSQGHFQLADGLYRPRWVDLSVNCEACHGPGAEHVENRLAGDDDSVYRDLHAIGKQQDAELCGQCHGRHQPFHLGGDEEWRQPRVFVTLEAPDLRVDGTQSMPTYQIAGHLLSRCYQDGAMTCASCHTPHDQKARSIVGEDAEGDRSDVQCTVCHRDRIERAAARRHTRHGDDITCVDCHMAPSWMGDSPERQQRTADHSIQIPRPVESIALGTPNACNTCHADKPVEWARDAVREWGYERAQRVRPWANVIALARKRQAGAVPGLLAVLDDPASGDYLRQSALELLMRQPPDPTIPPKIATLAGDPDPHTRAAAIGALMAHDGDAERWRKLGANDEHPYVRYVAFTRARDIRALSEEEMAQIERDVVESTIIPFGLLGMVADAYAARGEPHRALAVIENAGGHLNPIQRTILGLSDRRARLLAR